MKLYNTKTRHIEEFTPLDPPTITYYSCGPTVYDYSHLGHLRTYISQDILKRILTSQGFEVKHMMNITDVGHLTGDDDFGEDKLEKGAVKHGKTIDEVVKFFTDFYFSSTDAVNIIRPEIIANATKHIQDMIGLIKRLEEKGFIYETNEAVYFDTSKYKDYGSLSGQELIDKKQRGREEVHVDPDKKHPVDFAVWFKCVGRFKDHTMKWESPWGAGFPGWHIECSAMSMKYLGETIDIHAGGIDHIPVHHENEIAQSECATGKEFVRYWFHSEFLMIDGEKMSKSKGNLFTIDDVHKRNIDPIALRYLFLQTHYRQVMNFTWDALLGAQSGLNKLRETVLQLKNQSQRTQLSEEKLKQTKEFSARFDDAISEDLQIPKALAMISEIVKSSIPSEDKLDLIYEFDHIFGLGLSKLEKEIIPENILKLANTRQLARENKDFDLSDKLRDEIKSKGYVVKDTDSSYIIKKDN